MLPFTRGIKIGRKRKEKSKEREQKVVEEEEEERLGIFLQAFI